MSIATLPSIRPTATFAPISRPAFDAPAPAPSPEPPAPTDPQPEIDFNTIDTPQKAALLPSLNAGAFLLTLNAISNAAQAGAGLTSALQLTLGQATSARMDYALQADASSFGIAGQGAFGGQAAQESWAFGNDGIAITGAFGGSAEDLKVTQGDDGLHLDGTIGGVEVHQLINNAPDGNGVVFQGMVGDQVLVQALTVSEDDNGAQTLHVNGKLGDADIAYDEAVNQTETGLTLTGAGNIAGTPVQINHALDFQFGKR